MKLAELPPVAEALQMNDVAREELARLAVEEAERLDVGNPFLPGEQSVENLQAFNQLLDYAQEILNSF